MSTEVRDVYEELALRFRRSELLLLRAVRRQRRRPATRAKGDYWGATVTDDEVDALLANHGEIDPQDRPGDEGLGEAIQEALRFRDDPGGRVGRLRRAFGLSGDDVDLLLLALLPEIASGYGRIFAYLNDNLNQPWLTVDLATRVLRPSRRERLALLGYLLARSPLLRRRLLLLHPETGPEPMASRRVHPAPRLLRWLLEGEELPVSQGFRPLPTDREPFVAATARERIEQLGRALEGPLNCLLVGSSSGAREALAQAIARRVGRPLVRVDLERCEPYLDRPADLLRELVLAGAVPLLVNVLEAQDDPQHRRKLAALGAALAELPWPVLVSAADRRTVGGLLGDDRPTVTVHAGRSTLAERVDAWRDAIARRGWDVEKATSVAERFYSVGGTTIEAVLDRAEAECGGAEPDLESLWAAARERSRPEFRGLAQQVVPRYTWNDLVLADRVRDQLQHLVRYLQHQETVFHRWGAKAIRPRGYGIKALFSGPPGTGKTMSAEVIAGSLGLDLFRVDLSQVVSRWVGETEKNLKEIFDAAEGGVAVVLFDEADALFGARGDVKQAQDRFANQEVSFLLQRLEVFEGCAILTTNLQENIDEAFLRRFGAVVEFQMPSVAERLELWRRAIPRHAPVADDLDLPRIADRFVLAGGSIVNAAINACILAAHENRPLGMSHLVRAIGRELIKMGRQVNRVHFGEYYEQVADL